MDLIKELEDIIKMNKEQRNNMIKEYLKLYFKSMYQDVNGKDKRKLLIKRLVEYIKIIKCENYYMSIISEQVSQLKNIEEIEELMNEIDYLNERSYLYFISIIEEYEEYIECGLFDRKIGDKREFSTLIEREDIKEKVFSIAQQNKKT